MHDVPAVLVTGTNGKTTTVRLLAAMARASGLVAGTTSTKVHRSGEIERWHGGWKQVMIHVDEIPLSFNGAARHNIANALAALALG